MVVPFFKLFAFAIVSGEPFIKWKNISYQLLNRKNVQMHFDDVVRDKPQVETYVL